MPQEAMNVQVDMLKEIGLGGPGHEATKLCSLLLGEMKEENLLRLAVCYPSYLCADLSLVSYVSMTV